MFYTSNHPSNSSIQFIPPTHPPLHLSTQGNTRTILHKFSVDLPKKHGRGGQSAVRFARLRMEARHNYVRKVAELAVHYFITDNKVGRWVGGLWWANHTGTTALSSFLLLFTPLNQPTHPPSYRPTWWVW